MPAQTSWVFSLCTTASGGRVAQRLQSLQSPLSATACFSLTLLAFPAQVL